MVCIKWSSRLCAVVNSFVCVYFFRLKKSKIGDKEANLGFVVGGYVSAANYPWAEIRVEWHGGGSEQGSEGAIFTHLVVAWGQLPLRRCLIPFKVRDTREQYTATSLNSLKRILYFTARMMYQPPNTMSSRFSLRHCLSNFEGLLIYTSFWLLAFRRLQFHLSAH